MKRLALLVLIAFASGCATTAPQRLAQLALPAPQQLDCCWQSRERVQIAADGKTLTLDAAVALTPGQLTLVAFDGLGRRLVALSHTGGTPHTLQAPPGWSAVLSHQLLLALYLHHLPLPAWEFAGPDWTVSEENNHRVLRRRGQELVRLRYLTAEATENGREIDYIGQNMLLTVHSLSRNAL